MSTDNLAIITSTLPSRTNSTAKSSVAPAKSSNITPVVIERQSIAASGNNQPVSNVAERAINSDDDDRLDEAVSDINSYVQNINRKLQFSVNEDLPLGRAVIKVIDSETDKVIREIPSEEAIAIAKRISEQFEETASIEGLVFTDHA